MLPLFSRFHVYEWFLHEWMNANRQPAKHCAVRFFCIRLEIHRGISHVASKQQGKNATKTCSTFPVFENNSNSIQFPRIFTRIIFSHLRPTFFLVQSQQKRQNINIIIEIIQTIFKHSRFFAWFPTFTFIWSYFRGKAACISISRWDLHFLEQQQMCLGTLSCYDPLRLLWFWLGRRNNSPKALNWAFLTFGNSFCFEPHYDGVSQWKIVIYRCRSHFEIQQIVYGI